MAGQQHLRPGPKSTLYRIVKSSPKIPSILTERSEKLRSLWYTSEGSVRIARHSATRPRGGVKKARAKLEIIINTAVTLSGSKKICDLSVIS